MIIGICGFQSSGKDTIADLLVREYGYKKLSFASMLKDIVSLMFGWPRDRLEGLTKEDREWREQIDPWWAKTLDKPMLSPRYVLQYFGTELFRNNWHPEIWIKIVEKQLNNYTNVVITDCRFTNEINMLKQNGGQIIHVHRNKPVWFDKYKLGEDVDEINNLHVSEREWIRCYNDYDILNDGTIDDLYNKVKHILKL